MTRLAYLAFVAAALLAVARAGAEPAALLPRRFDFERDTFAFTNELYWSYGSAPGGASAPPHAGPIEFGQRCVNVVRSARQFFDAAHFSPGAPLTEEEYRERVRAVLASDPRADVPAADPVDIPGFADLRSFSLAHERLLKEELGGTAASYLQRGNWRMILPFLRREQRATAEALLERLGRGGLPVVRAVNFPVIDINHAVLVFDAEIGEGEIRFRAYDPNDAERPVTLAFDRVSARFHFPRTRYFAGGVVNVYEIFTGPFF